MVAVLTPKSGGKSIVIDKAVVLVGRHPDCDYILQNSRKVSRRHVCIVQVNEKYMVRDLGSMNGVCVNGTRVKNEQRITLGDEVAIGDVLFRFEDIQRIPRPPRKDAAQVAPVPAADSNDEALVTDEPILSAGLDDPDVSREFPVAIPEEDKSFAVIESPSEVEVISDDSSFFNDDEPQLDDVPELFDEADIGSEELFPSPDAGAVDEEVLVLDDVVVVDDKAVIKPLSNDDDEPGFIELVDEIEVLDTVEESASSSNLAASYDEFAPIVEVGDQFNEYDDIDEDDVEDVIILDDD